MKKLVIIFGLLAFGVCLPITASADVMGHDHWWNAVFRHPGTAGGNENVKYWLFLKTCG